MVSTTESSSFPTTGAGSQSMQMSSGDTSPTAFARVDSTLNGETVNRVARSAHDVVDRVAEKALPAVERLRTGLYDARDAVKARADNLTVMQEEWTTQCRTTIREKPLTSVAVAVVAGMFLSRLLSR